MADEAHQMFDNAPEQPNPEAKRAWEIFFSQQKAASSNNALHQQDWLSHQYHIPQIPVHANSQSMLVGNSSYTTPPSAHIPGLQTPSSDTTLALQSGFYGQGEQSNYNNSFSNAPLEVEKNKRQHVKSLVDALRHKGFKTAADPPKTKKDQAEGDQAEGVQL